jgi:50S ribosomal subunit-associated GTPase HflX
VSIPSDCGDLLSGRLQGGVGTLLSYGKVREVAQACEQADADAVIFVASLTERQRHALTALLGCPAVSLSHILAAD